MSSRISRTIAIATLVAAACTSRPPSLDLCGRGDRADLSAALHGGHLDLTFVDDTGAVLTTTSVPADPSDVALSSTIPARATSVRVEGRGPGAGLVARGAGPTAHGGGCVCFALVGQDRAACDGVTCHVDGGQCRFDPPGPRTLVFGDNEAGDDPDDITGVTADTYLRSAPSDQPKNFGAEADFRADSDPAMVGLLRFELAALPRTSTVTDATLTLGLVRNSEATTSFPIRFYRVREPWAEGTSDTFADGCASWNCRQDATPWTTPGCGPGSRDTEEAAILPAATVIGAYSLPITGAVAGWVKAPASNFGLAFTVDGGAAPGTSVWFVSREAPPAAGPRPRLAVTFTLDD
jgi:hypothetical protein